ncbi:MAG TPA: redoxin domain-containing protein [Candidatus Bilamarchaeaceae archaeon]|nr:redoxin domain-containing protein [Candidatus Bilamarchaeaceae archaeon]
MTNVGDNAPNFTLKDQDLNEVSLENFKGKKVLLAFYPFAFSPVCSDELACFKNDLSQFRQKGVEVVGISIDSHWTQKAFANSLGIEYPLLSDFDKHISKKYGVLRQEGFSNRAYFIINEHGKITFKHVMENPATKLDDDELFEALK